MRTPGQRHAVILVGMMAGVSLGVLASTACAPQPAVNNDGYVLCNDTGANAVDCGNDTSPVMVDGNS